MPRVKLISDYTCFAGFQSLPLGIKCEICHVTFSSQSAISAHNDTAHAQNDNQLERTIANDSRGVCGKLLSNEYKVKEHRSVVHGISGQSHVTCEVCGKTLSNKYKLKRHLETVHGVGDVKAFVCHICQRVFKLNYDLSVHLRQVHKLM